MADNDIIIHQLVIGILIGSWD